VILDVYRKRRFSKLTTHSKLVLIVTAILILSGAAMFLAIEWTNPKTLGAPGMGLLEKIMASFFQSVTTRTAGFNTIDQNGMTAASKLLSVILMFIGASPGGTGGGIKTSTFSVILLMVAAVLQGQDEVVVLKRKLDRMAAFRALAIAVISMAVVTIVSMGISLIEIRVIDEKMNFLNVLFEVTSGFGTVGLSTGITPGLHPVSKLFLILTMYIGRVGPLTLLVALVRQLKLDMINVKYPDCNIMVG
jgi:trk system potassium uptake protein TrkH